VQHGLTGLLCPSDPGVDDVIDAVTKMSSTKALSLRQNCQLRAQLFAADIFVNKMKQLIDCENDELGRLAASLDAGSKK
jgi:hypothetical protein